MGFLRPIAAQQICTVKISGLVDLIHLGLGTKESKDPIRSKLIGSNQTSKAEPAKLPKSPASRYISFAPANPDTNDTETPMPLRSVYKSLAGLLLILTSLLAPLAASAQAWPAKPIKLIVNFPAGGSPDIVARAVATPVSQALGQPIVVENRSGAGGIIGADAAAKSAPDGYTILLSSGSAMSIVPHVTPKMPFDPAKDLVPVAAGARLELFLVSHAELPFTNYADFIRHAKPTPANSATGLRAMAPHRIWQARCSSLRQAFSAFTFRTGGPLPWYRTCWPAKSITRSIPV